MGLIETTINTLESLYNRYERYTQTPQPATASRSQHRHDLESTFNEMDTHRYNPADQPKNIIKAIGHLNDQLTIGLCREPAGTIMYYMSAETYDIVLHNCETEKERDELVGEDLEYTSYVTEKKAMEYLTCQPTPWHKNILHYHGPTPEVLTEGKWGLLYTYHPIGPLSSFLRWIASPSDPLLHNLALDLRPVLRLRWAIQLCNCLAYIHKLDIFHGNIRAQSCWLSEQGLSLKLSNFIGARCPDATFVPPDGEDLVALQEESEKHGVPFVPPWTKYWLFNGQSHSNASWTRPLMAHHDVLDRKTDVFGLGSTLFEIFSRHGTEPFADIPVDEGERLGWFEGGRWVGYLPDLVGRDGELVNIIGKCWEEVDQGGYGSVEEVRGDLVALARKRGFQVVSGDEGDLDVDVSEFIGGMKQLAEIREEVDMSWFD